MNIKEQDNNRIQQLTISFALGMLDLVEELEKAKKFVFADQMLRSGTSIGANVHESQNAESLQDFIHKMKIAAKEAEEVSYWLELCKRKENYPYNSELHDDLISIKKMLNKIIGSSKRLLKERTKK